MQRQIRITNPDKLDKALFERELNEGNQVFVQFSDKRYNGAMLSQINQMCIAFNDNFHVRFFGHHKNVFDCNTVKSIPNVKALTIDCEGKVNNVDAITVLPNLQRIGIGIFDMKETEILSAENLQQVHELRVSETKTKAFNLDYLRYFKNLLSLSISKHSKNIEAISTLSNLNTLGLSSISKVPLNFVNALKKLSFLRIILGGRDNILEIKENEIEHLELILVRGLNDLSNIGNFKKLKTLLIEDQIRLPHIHFDTQLSYLTELKVLNCKTLSSLTGLENLTALEHLRIYQTNIEFETFVKQSFPPLLKILAFYTAKLKIDAKIKERLGEMGYIDRLDRDA